MNAATLVSKLWNYCNVLRDDGLSYGDYVEQLTYLLFLKMADERTRAPFDEKSPIPKGFGWNTLRKLDGDDLETHYRHTLEELGKRPGIIGTIFRKAQNKIQDPEAYQFLSENYCAGDEVWLFGFSRGAYTVRRVVGMLRKCGMLPSNLDRQTRDTAIREGYEIYVRRERADQGGADSQAALDFREKYRSPRIPIRFLGVWDTVGAYGIGGMLGQLAGKARFHDSKLSSDVEYACHAVAIDEQRTAFRPALWEQTPNGKDKGQLIEQSWFAGVHSNIGGGYQDSGLSDLALHWMAARAEARGLGLDEHWRDRLAPDVFGELRESRTGIYRLLGKAVRDIGVQANGFERLHQAPHDRLQRDPAPYEPENLLAYLNSQQTRFDFSEPGL